MAQLAIAAVGAAAGGFFAPGVLAFGITGSQAGWMLGSLVGSAFGKKQHSYGPKLDDLKVTGVGQGQAIPWVIGAPRLAAVIAWASERRETATTTTAGKGSGPKSTTYSYETDVLYLLADNQLEGVTRIWLNGKLVWTQLGAASSESLASSDQTELWRRITFYPGAVDELPDPTYEAAVGTDNAPAYRGRAKLFIEGLQLGNSGQLPLLTFEACSRLLPGGTSLNSVMAEIPLSSGDWGFDAPQIDDSGGLRFAAYSRTTVHPFDEAFGRVYYVSSSGDVSIQGTYTALRADLIGRGNSHDLHGLIFAAGFGGYSYWFYSGSGGAKVRLQPTHQPGTSGDLTPKWSAVGSNVYFAYGYGGGGSDKRVFRFTTAGGAQVANSASIASGIQCIAASLSAVYCVSDYLSSPASALTIYHLDPVTLATIGTLPWPVGLPQDGVTKESTSVHVNQGGELFLTAGRDAGHRWYKWFSGDWRLVSSDTGGAQQGPMTGVVSGDRQKANIRTNTLYAVTYDTTNTKYVIYRANATASPGEVTLSETVQALCARAGMPAGSYDTTGLDGITKPVRAMAIAEVGSTRPAIEQLMAAYFFTATLSDKIRFNARATSPVVTIPFADLAAGVDQAADEAFPLAIDNDLEIPSSVAVQYKNANTDQQAGTEYSDRVLAGQSSTQTVQLGLVFTPAEAKGVADAICNDNLASLVTVPVSVGLYYAAIEPGDVVQVVDDRALTHRLRITTKSDDGAVLKLGTVRDDAAVIASSQITDVSEVQATEVTSSSTTNMQPLDIPLLRDVDDGPGYVVTAKGDGTAWPGAILLSSANGVDYSTAAEINESGVFGVVVGTFADFTGGAVTDGATVLQINIGRGELASTTRDSLLANSAENVLLVGSEIVQFQTAVLTGTNPNTYDVSMFFRGRLGTEWAMTGHTSGERVVLLRARGMRHVTQAPGDIGQVRHLKGVSIGRSPDAVSAQSFTNTGVSQKPWAPVSPRTARNSAGDVLLSWSRRSRLSTTFMGAVGSSVPIGEASESYAVDVYSAGFATLKRTIASVSPSVIYTAAQQVEDFGAAQSSLAFNVYQLSQAVGRGYPMAVSISDGFTPVAQESTVTISGTFAAGFRITVYSGSTLLADYTTVGGDADLTGVAASLAGAISGGGTGYSAVSIGAVVTVTGPLGAPYFLNVAVAASGWLPSYLVQAAATASPGFPYESELFIGNRLSGNIDNVPAGTTFSVEFQHPIDIVVGTISVTTSRVSAAKDVYDLISEAVTTNTALVDGGFFSTTTLHGGGGYFCRIRGPRGANVQIRGTAAFPYEIGNSIQFIGSEGSPIDAAQIVDIGFIGTATAGDTYRVTLGGVDYQYSAAGADTAVEVAAGLATDIDGAAAYIAVPTDRGLGGALDSVRITASSVATPFTYSTRVIRPLVVTVT